MGPFPSAYTVEVLTGLGVSGLGYLLNIEVGLQPRIPSALRSGSTTPRSTNGGAEGFRA